jgi:hypothetical protein
MVYEIETKCSSISQIPHFLRRCTGQPVSSGRRERARDWLGEVQVARQEEEAEKKRKRR